MLRDPTARIDVAGRSQLPRCSRTTRGSGYGRDGGHYRCADDGCQSSGNASEACHLDLLASLNTTDAAEVTLAPAPYVAPLPGAD
jgi:hypothetical protein